MKYMITSVQLGARLNKNLYRNMLKFKKEHSVDKILVFIMNGPYKAYDTLHPSVATLADVEFISGQMMLNSKVRVYDTKVLAQNVDPHRGLSNKLPSQYSYITSGTKIRQTPVPSLGTNPRFFISTGALTEPLYKEDNKGIKAKNEHEFGFTFFTDKGRGKLDVYSVKSQKNGNFQYFLEKYHNGKINLQTRVPALVFGDIHVGDHNPEVIRVAYKQLRELNPKEVFIHDLFNAHSINHHESDNLLSKLRALKNRKVSFEDELRQCLKFIEKMAKEFPDTRFNIVESNHDVFITRYLQERRFMKDDLNFMQAIKIIPRVINVDSVVLKEAFYTLNDRYPLSNINFLRENDSMIIHGVECAQHGHKGSNGSRGSLGQFKKNNTRSATGHTHSPALYGKGMIVGTFTWLELPYTIGGYSSWLNAGGIIYDNGTYALITIIPKKKKPTKY